MLPRCRIWQEDRMQECGAAAEHMIRRHVQWLRKFITSLEFTLSLSSLSTVVGTEQNIGALPLLLALVNPD